MTVPQVMEEVLEDLPFYRTSGGGLTLSGGEPMAQSAFALAIAQAAKEQNLHVAMETSGYCAAADLMAIRPYVDLFLYDYKLTGDEAHRRHTGVDQQRILENLHLLDASGASIILRCPMIPGVNIHPEHEAGIICVAGGLRNLQQIHLEPYHNIGLSKRERLGMDASCVPSLEKGGVNLTAGAHGGDFSVDFGASGGFEVNNFLLIRHNFSQFLHH